MPTNNMPKDWTPPYPSYSADFPSEVKEVVIGYFAVQSKERHVESFTRWMREMLCLDHAPLHTEFASYLDISGYVNSVYICYWNDKSVYDKWESSQQVSAWWKDDKRLKESCGYWREVLFVPMQRLETALSSDNRPGMSAMAPGITGEIREHAYWGSMRDRIPDSDNDPFESDYGDGLTALPSVVSKGKRQRVSPPKNLCLIRSGQNWTECKGEELNIYQNEIHPVLINGMDFLRDNPIETGCISCRFMNESSLEGEALDKTFGMAYFLTMGHLEKWAKSHPTHLAIFQSFHKKMAQKLEAEMELKLWHEVVVLSEGSHIFEYLNCHEKTGLLPYFEPD